VYSVSSFRTLFPYLLFFSVRDEHFFSFFFLTKPLPRKGFTAQTEGATEQPATGSLSHLLLSFLALFPSRAFL